MRANAPHNKQTDTHQLKGHFLGRILNYLADVGSHYGKMNGRGRGKGCREGESVWGGRKTGGDKEEERKR